jgi:hypothetical protein
MRIDRFATHFGINAGGSINGGGNNTLYGYNAGRYISTGNQNVGVGTVLGALTTGGDNVAMGPSAAGAITTGGANIMIGRNAAANINGNSNQNTIIGGYGWNAGTPSAKHGNTGLGYIVGSTNNGNYNLFLGYTAGYYVTGSNNILIDTILRADEATSKSSALIYGVTNATASSQTLSLGGGGNVGIGTTSPAYKLDVFGSASSAGGVNSNIGYNITLVTAPVAGMTATPVAGSGLNIGQYYYAITFYNALGETNAYFGLSAVTTTGNQQVNLASIPISTNTTVIGRKIYRGKVGEGLSYGGLIATIANNTATTYSDTIPDSSVPGGGILDRAIYGKPNLSANYISVGGIRSLVLDTNLTAFGIGAGNAITNAPNSTFIGYRAGYSVTSGSGNTLVGRTAGSSITGGFQNTIVGDTSGNGITTGSYNIGFGPNVLNSAAAGSFNIAAGYYTMNKGTGSYNILLGGYNWSSGTPTASYCTFIGGSLTNISTATNYQVNINDLITGISSGTKYVNILGSLGIGLAYGTAPAPTAILQIDSTTQGFLPPRMTTLQKIGITLPAKGLIIFDTDLNKLCVFTTAWETVTSV